MIFLLAQATAAATNPPLNLPSLDQTGPYPDITTQAAVLIFLALLPFMIMLLTSFAKMVIVLSLLRNSLGVQQIPPQPSDQRDRIDLNHLRDVSHRHADVQ